MHCVIEEEHELMHHYKVLEYALNMKREDVLLYNVNNVRSRS